MPTSRDGERSPRGAGCRYGFLCCTSSPCCRLRCRIWILLVPGPARVRAIGLNRGRPCFGRRRRPDPQCGCSPRRRPQLAHQHAPVEIYAFGGLRGKIQPGRFGSGSLPGDAVFRRQSRERLAHHIAAAERNHTARSEAVLQRIEARAGQVIFAGAEFHDARELQDIRSAKVTRSPAPLWSSLGSLLPDWLGW